MFDVNVRINPRDLNGLMPKKLPNIQIGIFKEKKLFSWEKEITKLTGTNITVNKKTREQWGSETVKSSFASTLENTPLMKYFQRVFDKRGEVLILDLFNKVDNKVIQNNFAAMLKQAWVAMAKKERNKKKRVEQKGFNSYAIGTGQTLDTVEARVVNK